MLRSTGALLNGGSLTTAALALWPTSSAASASDTPATASAPAAPQPAKRPDAPPMQPPEIEPRTRRIQVAYFSRDTGSLRSLTVDDADARSCDCRQPDANPAYDSVRQYIRDNDLMAREKVSSIWRWLDAISCQGYSELFVYDQDINWYRQLD